MIRDYYSDETISNETLYANCDRLTWTVDILFEEVYLEDLQRNRAGGTFDWLIRSKIDDDVFLNWTFREIMAHTSQTVDLLSTIDLVPEGDANES